MRLTTISLILLFIYMNTIRAQSLEVKFVEPYSQARINVSLKGKEQKEKIISLMNQGEYKVVFNTSEYKNTKYKFNSLIGERKIITFDVINSGNNDLTDVEISSNLPSDWNPTYMKQSLLNDWYSNQNKNINHLLFIGDPLLNLRSRGDMHFLVNLRSKETVRIVLEFTPVSGFNDKIKININKGSIHKTLSCDFSVYEKKMPDTEFSSIAFDGTNAVTGTKMFPTLKSVGFTHLQVNFIPVIYFDKYGNPLNKTYNHSESNTIGFKNTANEWIKINGKILLYWQPRYNILAPLSKGKYLKPFTPEWNNAFCSLLEVMISEFKKIYPNFTEDQIVVYIADEVSSAHSSAGVINNYIQLSSYIKKNCPSIKIFSTFGYYTLIEDIKHMENSFDIASMHFLMPEKSTSSNRRFSPFRTKVFFDQIKKPSISKWYYNVENGIKADIRNFRFFPLIAAANNYDGFSWWAFSSHSGSTWMNNSTNGLNYSLYYRNEPNNKIYKMWRADAGNPTGSIISSMRLKAIEIALNDARLIKYLKLNTHLMTRNDLTRFNKILEGLSTYSNLPDSKFNHPELSYIEDLSYILREIYSTLPN